MGQDEIPRMELGRGQQTSGNEIMKSIIPALMNNDADGILWKGTETTLEGTLTPHFEYLTDYVATAH